MATSSVTTCSSLTYRVRGIPATLDSLGLCESLKGLLPKHKIKIWSLAKALHQIGPESTQDATVTFDGPNCPNLEQMLSGCANLSKIGSQEWMVPKSATGFDRDITIDSHFFGLTVLYVPENSKPHFTDYIAVTGLGGRALASWMPSGNSQFMWLRDELPRRYSKVRIIIYGYDTCVLNSQSEQLPTDLGRSLAQSLRASGLIRAAASRLVFIVHSLGGIVLKHALVHMAQAGDEYTSMLLSVERIMLFGVPTRGMKIDHLLAMVQEDLQPNECLVRQLDPGNPLLAEVDREFSRICKDKQIRIISIYEQERTRVTKKVDGQWKRGAGDPVLLVPQDSAVHHLSSSADCLAINKDHSAIAKLPEHSGDLERIVACLKPNEDEYPEIPKDRYFPCREDELNSIREHFDQKDAQDHATFVVLHGLSGMGKTLVALEYAERNGNQYTDVIKISGESEERFVSSVAMMPKLNIEMKTHEFQHVSKVLARHINESPCVYLVIIDDMHSMRNRSERWKGISGFLDQLRKGHILITAPDISEMSRLRCHDIPLRPLSLNESRALFDKNRRIEQETNGLLVKTQRGSGAVDSGRDVTKAFQSSDTDTLLERLNGHPMAIHHLANFFRVTKTPPSEYMKRYTFLLDEDHSKTSGARHSSWEEEVHKVLSSIWDVYHKELCKKNLVGLEILEFWVFLHQQDFSFKIFQFSGVSGFRDNTDSRGPLNLDEGKFTHALGHLIQLNLVDQTSEPGSYAMHDLPFTWFRNRFRESGKKWAVAATVGHAVTDRDSEPHYWIWCQRLLPHAKTLWCSNLKSPEKSPTDQDTSPTVALSKAEGLLALANLFRTHSEYKIAQEILTGVKELEGKYSREWGPQVLLPYELCNHQGNLYKDLGDPKKALEMFKKAYEGLCMHDCDLEFQLDVLSNLASQYEKTGDLEEATKKYEELLKDKRVTGNKWLGNLTRCANLQFNQASGLTGEQRKGFLDKAHQTYVKVYKRYLGSKYGSLRVARAEYNLAVSYCHREDTISKRIADELYQRALPTAIGERRDNYLPYRIQLEHGRLCGRVLRLKQAEQLLQNAIAGFERIEKDLVSGPNKQGEPAQWYEAKESLAELYWSWRRFDEAEDLYRDLHGCGDNRDERWLTQKLGQRRNGVSERHLNWAFWKVRWQICGLFYLRFMPEKA